MYLLDHGVEVDAEMQSSAVNDIDKVSQRISDTHEIAIFHGRPQLPCFLLDEFTSAECIGHGDIRPQAYGRTDIAVELSNQTGRRLHFRSVTQIHPKIIA